MSWVGAFHRLKFWQRMTVAFLLSLPLAFVLRLATDRYLGPDLASAAQAYVRMRKEAPLSEPLRQLLADGNFTPQSTQDHPLLGQAAPNFSLLDDGSRPVELASLHQDGPVVIIFYYGYFCSHCVAQLFAVNEDLALFRELGARVVAVSADPPELTAKRYAEFGRFGFTVVADPDNRVAEQFRIYRPPTAEQAGFLKHATFIVDAEGKVRWANAGADPFLDNKTLLVELARCGGLLQAQPESKPATTAVLAGREP
jgi:peroxiredoxin Q/BCP